MLFSVFNHEMNLVFNPKLPVFENDDFFIKEAEKQYLSEGYYLSETPSSSDIESLGYADFVERYKGRYVCVAIDKKKKTAKIYNDLLSKQFVFYYQAGENFACSTSFMELLAFVKEKPLPYTVDELGIKQFLDKGFFQGEHTYIKEIKFLSAFSCLRYDGTCRVDRLSYPEPLQDVSFEDARDEAYRLFQKAAKAQIEKNNKENRRHIISLSGGMDSRAMFLQLIDAGIKDIESYCYAESGSVDEKVAEQIAKDYHTKHHFFPLDGGNFVKNRDAILDQNEGMMMYSGATGMFDCIQMVDCTQSGVVHMGIGGGEILGDIVFPDMEQPFEHFPKKSYMINLDDIRCCQNSALTGSNRFAFASPFLYEDFFLYLMRLPESYKRRRRLYVAMYEKYMQNNYDTTAFRGKIGRKRSLIERVFHYVKAEILKKDKYSMNPFEYWWATNPVFKNYIKDSFSRDIEILTGKNYDSHLLQAYFEKSIYHKLRALTLSAMLNRILE